MSQKNKILSHLKTFGCISTWQAIQDYHITRLGAHICQLRIEGFNITDEVCHAGKKWWKLYKLQEVS